METIIGYIPSELAEIQPGRLADEIADACGLLWGREKGTLPVMLHMISQKDGNQTGCQTVVYYVYTAAACTQTIKEQAVQKMYDVSQTYIPNLKEENHVIIFKLHEKEDMGINGKFEG